jgi:HEPN domain-containing protein
MPEIHKSRLIELAEAKLQDAKLLLDNGRTDNAYYLAGYAIELMLKAILSTRFRTDTLPDRNLLNQIFVHDLVKLTQIALLDRPLKDREENDPAFRAYWQIVLKWTEASRYGEYGKDEAGALIEAIENSEHGVLPWLRSKL